MNLAKDRERWVPLIESAQRGDASAWPAIIDRFEDLAVATAVGLHGDLDDAPDIAQEAFVLAFRHIQSLKDPAAFPAWLHRLVRTSSNRRLRRRRHRVVPLDRVDDNFGAAQDAGVPPDETVLAAIEHTNVRAAVDRLAEGERCVVALHYLAGMPYAEVASFLGITESAAKKRAWSARTKLKELLPMVTDAFAAARPSDNDRFRDAILLFQAIRVRDKVGLAQLLERDPDLATATEDWSPTEGFESRLGFSEHATALIRAAETGDLSLVRLLVEAGAPVSERCPCANHESPLVVAITIGATDVVDYLLEQGASVTDRSFDGESTPLHIAMHRDNHDLARRLLAAGADPEATDAYGRTPADWSSLKGIGRVTPTKDEILWTRIRAIDLFAPLRPGALVHIPPAYGLGAMRAIYGIVDALKPARWWMIGFEHGPFEPADFERETRTSGTPATISLVGVGDAADRRRQFAESLERLAASPGPKVVMCVPTPGHEHDITVALPDLAADASVLATVVMAPYTAEPAPVPRALPEGFDARITFDKARASARYWPAIDPATTSARTYPSERHKRLADAARSVLDDYATHDPAFELPDPDTLGEPDEARRAQALVRYLCHSFRPFEMLSAAPAPDTPIDELLDTVEELVAR